MTDSMRERVAAAIRAVADTRATDDQPAGAYWRVLADAAIAAMAGDVDDETIYALVRSFDRGSVPEDVDRVRALLAQQAAANHAEVRPSVVVKLTADLDAAREQIDQYEAEVQDLRSMVEMQAHSYQLRVAELADAREQIERVRALIAEAEYGGLSWGGFVRDLGAALRGERA